MSNHSPKVTQFLKNHPDFEKNYKSIYAFIKKANPENITAMGSEARTQLEKKLGNKIDMKKVEGFIGVTKKLNESEFLTWAAGDHENLPPLQLNNAEMAMVKGGGFWGAVGSVALVGLSFGQNDNFIEDCRGWINSVSAPNGSGKDTAPVKK